MQGIWVWSLVEELGSHMQHRQNILKVNFIDFYCTTVQISHNYMCTSLPSIPSFFGASLVAQMVKRSYLQCRRPRPGFSPWVGEIPRRREWHPTPVLPGESHGQRDLVGYSPWGYKTSDKTEQLPLTFSSFLGLPSPPHLTPLGCYSTKLGALCYVSASY